MRVCGPAGAGLEAERLRLGGGWAINRAIRVTASIVASSTRPIGRLTCARGTVCVFHHHLRGLA